MGQDENRGPQIELPRYRCHKVVEAIRIDRITWRDDHLPGEHPPWWHASLWADDQVIGVDSIFMGKHKPQVGGYYVRYADGYESWSTAEAFEGGYQLMEGSWNPGQVAFEAYNTSRGGVNHQGNPTPPWAELPGVIRTAWNQAAAAVLSRAHEHMQGGEVPRPGSPG